LCGEPIGPIYDVRLEIQTMILSPFRSSAALVFALVLAGPAAAQSSNYRSMNAVAGKIARVAVVTALKKDCSVGEIGGVRVVTVPKNGNLSLKKGKLKTPATFRCPNVETPAEVVFYQPKANFKGEDEIVYETKSADGAVERYTVKITVSDKPAPADKKDDAISL
jgi:hypothetical protein